MESPNLISLDEFNRRRTVIDAATKLPQPNGIACPQCGKGRMKVRTSRRVGDNLQEQRLRCACGYYKVVRVEAAAVWRKNVVGNNKSPCTAST